MITDDDPRNGYLRDRSAKLPMLKTRLLTGTAFTRDEDTERNFVCQGKFIKTKGVEMKMEIDSCRRGMTAR